MSVFDKGLITVLVCSAVCSFVSIPLILRRVPRNPVYGYRTRATLGDDKIWYEANVYFGVRFLITSILSACIAVVLHEWQGFSPATYLKVSIVLIAAPVVIAGLLTVWFVRSTGTGGQSSKGRR